MAEVPDSPPATVPTGTSVKVSEVVLDTHGDVTLVLPCSNGEARFQVNSAILCLASSVFQAMLGINSSFKEGHDLATRRASIGPVPPVKISLADDDPHALAVILRALHLQHEYVPASVLPHRLYEIAILCDKYNMKSSMAFWLEKWMPSSFSGYGLSADQWLFMSYAFLKDKEFKRLTREVMLCARTDDAGNLKIKDNIGLFSLASLMKFDGYVPQPIVGMY